MIQLRIYAFFLVFCLLFAPHDAQASAKDALRFAERKEWSNALGHARREGGALKTLITWMYVQDQDSRASFHEITGFIKSNPDWPQQQRLKLRAEQSLRFSDVSPRELKQWFDENPPISGIGRIRLAEMMLKEGASLSDDKVQFMIRDGWRNGDFEEVEEIRIVAVYNDILRPQDHLTRTDRLLWEEKTKAAERMLPYLKEGEKLLARARIALINNNSDAGFHVSRVPASFSKDPGLMHARMIWRARRGDAEGVREILFSAPTPVPYPERWWRQREVQVREAIDNKQYSLARKLLKNHGQVDGAEFAEATWLSGWLSLEFLKDPQDAYLQFYKMFDAVKFPVSRARAAYWAARAAEKANDRSAASSWYNTASSYPTTFYGQLAIAKTKGGDAMLSLPSDPSLSNSERSSFASRSIVRAVKIAIDEGKNDLASNLLYNVIDEAESDAQAHMAAAVASDIGSKLLSVRAAKRAAQRNVVLVELAYPTLKLNDGLPIEKPLALAITRQESEFDPRAKSRANAMGMMQLLAGTAKETARKAGVAYSAGRLYEPDYNILLGSHYLGRLINAYDGSYVMAIAAYNAGPGNVRKWVAQFGQPDGTLEGTINWIEKIPFTETRNYVMRVMENLQVYRARLNGGRAPLKINEDMRR